VVLKVPPALHLAHWLSRKQLRLVCSPCFSGIGFGIAQRLGKEGASVVLLDMKATELDAAVKVRLKRGPIVY
jgi:hypothetical protein